MKTAPARYLRGTSIDEEEKVAPMDTGLGAQPAGVVYYPAAGDIQSA
jgi:hypothetical protein